jgi:hypothetical protein
MKTRIGLLVGAERMKVQTMRIPSLSALVDIRITTPRTAIVTETETKTVEAKMREMVEGTIVVIGPGTVIVTAAGEMTIMRAVTNPTQK